MSENKTVTFDALRLAFEKEHDMLALEWNPLGFYEDHLTQAYWEGAVWSAEHAPAAQSAEQEAVACSRCGAESAKGCIEDRYCPLANAAPVNGGERALDLLATLFEAYENGPACYEDPSEQAGFVGNAVRLDDETFHACADLLNLHRPRDSERAADAQQANAINAELMEAAEMALSYIEAVCFNTPNEKKRRNYADAASKIRAALAKARGEA